MDTELRDQIEKELSRTLFYYVPIEVLTQYNLDDFKKFLLENYKSIPLFLVGGFIDYFNMIEYGFALPTDKIFRFAFFHGYFDAHNRMGHEIAFGVDIQEYRDFLNDESYMAN